MNSFKIIVPVYNGEEYIARCITSIQNQIYKNFECFIIDDCSTDSTFNIIKNIPTKDERFNVKRNNTENKKAIYNVIEGINLLCEKDNDIICLVDGDDMLFDDNVLDFLNDSYQNKDTWLTYGSYITESDNKKGCNQQIFNIRESRNPKINFSHLKTFKYFLWKAIKDSDLRRQDGKYIQRAWDSPIMRPMVEMCGLKHIKYVNKILYRYNNLSPLNEYKINEKEQLEENDYICHKLRYERL